MHIKLKHYGWLLSIFFISVATAGLFAANVQFQPDGVPLSRRAEYEKILQDIQERNAALADPASAATSHPRAVCDEPKFEFGVVDPHQTVSHAFVIRNEGAVDLRLSQGETSCKCTVGEIGSPIVPPGKSTEVLVTWNTGYQADNYVQNAVIKTDDPSQPELVLTVSGTIRADLAMTNAVIEFPAVTPNHECKSSTYIYSQLWEDFTIENVECDASQFAWTAEPIDVEMLPEGDLEARCAWKLTLFTTPSTHGVYKADAKISVAANTGETATRKFAIAGKTLGAIEFKSPDIDSASGLDLGLMLNDRDREKSIIVKVRDQGERRIEILDVKPDQLHATLTRTQQEGSYRLTLTAPQGAKAVVFNLHNSHGYVQVGDPEDKKFSNWMPLTGVIMDAANHASKSP